MDRFRENKWTVTALTSDTYFANVSKVLMELKEIWSLVVCSFWRWILESWLLHQWACLCYACFRESGKSRSVLIVEREYVFNMRMRIEEDGNDWDHAGIKVQISVLDQSVFVNVPSFSSVEWYNFVSHRRILWSRSFFSEISVLYVSVERCELSNCSSSSFPTNQFGWNTSSTVRIKSSCILELWLV